MAKPGPKKKESKRLQEGARACAMKLRVYPTRGQQGRLAQWLYCAKRFRNEAVAFCETRRIERARWLHTHPVLAQHWMPEDYEGSDSDACSKWLTERLEKARKSVALATGLKLGKKTAVEKFMEAVASMTRGELAEIDDGWWLSVPRTVFDQVLQDMKRTISRAIGDRQKAKGSNKKKKLAGWPKFRKWSFPGSIRLQVNAAKNKQFAQRWTAGELFIPGLGKVPLRFRDQRYVLPTTPPALITISRDAAGHFHASFLCVEKEYAQITGQDRQGKALPVDPETGLPVVKAIDLSLEHLGVDQQGKNLGRVRHLKRFAKGLRKKNKTLSRRQKGSSRWHKARKDLGRLHVRVANCREAELRVQAKRVVDAASIICLEDLMLAFMLQNVHLASSAHDAALGRFKQLLLQECRKQGKLLLLCGRFDPSSKACSTVGCDYINRSLKLADRTWTCPGCGTFHDRDHNAAINIQGFALQKAMTTLELSSGSENDPKMPSSLKEQMKHLHPDLKTFIARGGLTALLELHCSSKGHLVGNRQGLVGVDETRVLPKIPSKRVGNTL